MTNILVIDDDEGVCESFKIVLEPENRVETANSGEEGIVKAEINPPDIIFLDLNMPGIGGIDALIELQAIRSGIHTLIMTAFYEEYMRKLKKARDSCLFELCRKPMDRKPIKLIVNAYKNNLKLENGMVEKKGGGTTNAIKEFVLEFYFKFLDADKPCIKYRVKTDLPRLK